MIQQVVEQATWVEVYPFLYLPEKIDISGPLDHLMMTHVSAWPSQDWFDLFH